MMQGEDRLTEIQALLDAGNSRNKVADILGIHHRSVNRLVKKYNLEIYAPFDEKEDRIHLYQNFEWLWEEDKLEEIMYGAFDGGYLLNRSANEDLLKIGKYVKEKYETLHNYFISKGFSEVLDDLHILCNSCGNTDNLQNWYTDISKLWGLYSTCPTCRTKSVAKYVENNPEKLFEANQRRREMSNSLPTIYLEKDEWRRKRQTFKWKCAISKRNDTVSMDHFIPIAIGHGGTYYENLIPLNKSINSSKSDSNPFLWCDKNNVNRDGFNAVIEHLSNVNSLTIEEYRSFVFWCFDNKRNIDEVLADPRHSIEIWREATGIQFPLPAYVYKSRSNDILNEVGSCSIRNK